MKAISIRQPYAMQIVSGEKTIETRIWKTKYRGKILIVSSKTPQVAGMFSNGVRPPYYVISGK